MVKCEIYIYSTSEHIAQLCTGFSLLEAQKKIRLSYNFAPYSRSGRHPLKDIHPYGLQGMFVVIDDKTTIFYDTTDGENVFLAALEVSDIYFKRSYREDTIPNQYLGIVFPLGLNYEVYPGGFNQMEFARFFRNPQITRSPKQMVRSLMNNLGVKYQPTLSDLHSPPAPATEPKVLFMARTWDPDSPPVGFSAEKAQKWKVLCTEINEMRAAVIGLLRKSLGDRFYGGFSPSEHASAKYNQYLLQNANAAGKKEYIKTLREYPICIASTGLYNSIGWKMAEYVAFSKAIVSEKLYYEVPGDFIAGKNYLEFETADQCVTQTHTLVEDKVKREQMMESNYAYYQDFLSPDKLIWRTLEIALAKN